MTSILLRFACLTLLSLSATTLRAEQTSTDAVVLEQVSTILNIKKDQLLLEQPFSKQTPPADELDVVEIVMAIEEALNIEISDHALGKAVGPKGLENLPKHLTIKQLQRIVAEVYKSSRPANKPKPKKS